VSSRHHGAAAWSCHSDALAAQRTSSGDPSPGPAVAIVPALCPTCPHRAVQSRINPDDESASTGAQQGGCGAGGSSRTDLDESHPAENRRVGVSIPSLPTGFAQLSGLSAETPPLDERLG
jgi:hypothetical protein